MTRAVWIVGALALLPAAACGGAPLYQCTTDSVCDQVEGARCEPDGFCSIPAPECGSGFAYGEYSGELTGRCVQTGGTTTGAPGPTTSSGAGASTSSTSEAEDSSSTGGCTPCTIGQPCVADEQCASEICDEGQCIEPRSCAEVPGLGPGEAMYPIDPDGPEGADAFEVRCDGTTDGGGWTLIGAVVNDGTRMWTTPDVFLDASTFGDAATAPAADFKSPAWSTVAGDDLLVRSDEYAFAFAGALGATAFGPFIDSHWAGDAGCSTEFLAGPPSYAEGLTETEAAVFGLVVQPLDDNSMGCFPAGNETVAVGFTQQSAWTHGLGNYFAGGTSGWQSHDLSLLQLGILAPAACDPTTGYPCPPGGQVPTGDCYDVDCKVAYATLWVR